MREMSQDNERKYPLENAFCIGMRMSFYCTISIEKVSALSRFRGTEVSNLLTLLPENVEFDATHGKVNEIKPSGTNTKVTLRSNNGWTYKVTRHGKESK